ncbi:MAG: Rrf2 family transcriptional regulator [Phycisphaerales bacterium]
MRLTDRTDYALRVLMFLAVSRDRHTVAEMAAGFGVSANHLTKAVQQLQALGWVATTPGRSGGVEMAADPRRVRVGDVVRAIEPDLNIVECFRTDGACPLDGPCLLTGVLRDARAAFMASLDRVTLHDLVHRRQAKLTRVILTLGSGRKETA